jgi:hypothetical protein
MSSIRNMVALTAAAGGLGALVVFASLPATAAVFGNSPKLQSNTVVTQPRAPEANTPTTQCTNAKSALDAWKAKDKTEDTGEKANAGAANLEKTEDPTENADAKKLRGAVFTACASPACVADVKALTDAQAKDKAGEDAGEKTTSTEKSAADQKEDKTEKDSTKALRTKLRTDCAGIGK